MSVCVFIAANCPLPEVKPTEDYPLHINIDTNVVYDGGEDDNFFLLPFDDVNIYSEKKFGVYLELPLYTDGRARQIIDYISLCGALGEQCITGQSSLRRLRPKQQDGTFPFPNVL